MKKVIMAMLMMACSNAVFAQQPTTLQEIVSFMATNDYRLCFALTNSLDSLIVSTTGTEERATCRLLKASILLDHSENLACSTSFDEATNICREIESDLSGSTAWQRIGVLCKFTNAMLEDGHPEISFAASTNLLHTFQANPCIDVDTNVWNVLFKAGGLNVMPPLGFINANAAASLHRMDSVADISVYTNGIPQEILCEILRQ